MTYFSSEFQSKLTILIHKMDVLNTTLIVLKQSTKIFNNKYIDLKMLTISNNVQPY